MGKEKAIEAVARASGGRALAQLVGLGVMAVTNSVFGGAAVVFAANVLSRLRRDDDGTPDGTDGNFDGFLMGACVVAATSKPFGQLYKLNGILVILGMGVSIAGRAPEAWAESASYLSAAAEAKMAEAKPEGVDATIVLAAIMRADPMRSAAEAEWLTQASMAAARAEGGELDNGEVGLEAFCTRLGSCLVQRSDRHGED